MRVGIDVDDVLADFTKTLIRYYNNMYGTSLKINQFFSYRFWDIWGGTREEAIRIVQDFNNSLYFSQMQPISGAIKSVKSLVINNELIVITSREPKVVKETEEWIQRFFPNMFKGVYFTNNQYTGWGQIKKKSDVCLELSIDLIIEDSLEYSMECAENGIRALLFDRPWNKTENLPENVTRVYSWQEILKTVYL